MMFNAKSGTMLVKAASVTALLACTSLAHAGLYVSPVLKEDAKLNYAQNDNSAEAGLLKTSVSGDEVSIIMTSGRDLPLHIAVENIMPEGYVVNYQEGLHELEVTWSGGSDWKDTLDVMARQNNLHLHINEKESVVGLSQTKDMAFHLAKKMPTVWKVDTFLSLRENLKKWSDQAGWQLEWDPALDSDYPASHEAVFMGDFVGEGGVVEQLLMAYERGDLPLTPSFYLKNRVLVITKGGHKQRLSF